MYSDGTMLRSWPLVVIDTPEGREVFLTQVWDGLRRVLAAGYMLRKLNFDSARPLLWAEATASKLPPAKLVSRLVLTSLARKKFEIRDEAAPPAPAYDVLVVSPAFVANWRLPPARRRRSVAVGNFQRLRAAGIREGSIRAGDESRVWQVLAREHRVTYFRSDDLYEMDPIALEAPGRAAELLNAAEVAEGLLAEWQWNGRGCLSFHDAEGKLMASDLSPRPAGSLLSSDASGVYFVRWVKNLPVELSHVRAAVEWSRQP